MERMKHFAGMWLFSGISTQPRLTLHAHPKRGGERGSCLHFLQSEISYFPLLKSCLRTNRIQILSWIFKSCLECSCPTFKLGH